MTSYRYGAQTRHLGAHFASYFSRLPCYYAASARRAVLKKAPRGAVSPGKDSGISADMSYNMRPSCLISCYVA